MKYKETMIMPDGRTECDQFDKLPSLDGFLAGDGGLSAEDFLSMDFVDLFKLNKN